MNLLHQFGSTLSKPANNTELTSTNSTTNFLSFLDTYGKRLEELENEKFLLDQDKNKIQEELDIANNNLKTLNLTNFKDS